MDQRQFIHDFSAKHRPKFNPQLFQRSDEEIIYHLENIIKSAEREMSVGGYFTIRVMGFKVVEDYNEVRHILRDYQEIAINKSSKLKGITDNRYDFIDLKESDLKLLIVTYYIEAADGREMFDVLIAIPRVIDKFYFRINGNIRSAMYQIVDASTYNNGTSNSKKPMDVFKTIFQPIRVFRNLLTHYTVDGEEVPLVTYDADIFKKSVEMDKYIFAKMGLIKGLQFLGVDDFIRITDELPKNTDDYYVFLPKKSSSIYIVASKYALQNSLVVQHVVSTLCNEFTRKFAVLPFIFWKEYWLDALGRHFNLATPREKGISVLTSLEFIYDLDTKIQLRLPERDKRDIYAIFRWIMYEFNALTQKSNLDTSVKRLRVSEYIAALYAPKLSKGIYALSDMGEKVDTRAIKKRLMIDPMHLINEVTKSSLINFRDMMTDNDSYLALKYTYKGVSGIGESGSSAIPDIYKYLHVTNLGIVDLDSSSPSDPGVSGSIVPLMKLYDNGYFTDFQEPNTWRDDLTRLHDNYLKTVEKKQVMEFVNLVLDDSNVPGLRVRSSEEARAEMEKIFGPSKYGRYNK